MDTLSVEDLAGKVHKAKEMVRRAEVSLEAAKLDRARQKRKVVELSDRLKLIEASDHKVNVCRAALEKLKSMEDGKEPKVNKSAELKAILSSIADWSSHAKSLLTVIDLETNSHA